MLILYEIIGRNRIKVMSRDIQFDKAKAVPESSSKRPAYEGCLIYL